MVLVIVRSLQFVSLVGVGRPFLKKACGFTITHRVPISREQICIHNLAIQHRAMLQGFGWLLLIVSCWNVVTSSNFVCEDDYDCLPNGKCGNNLSCVCNPGFFGEQCTGTCHLNCQNGGSCAMINEHADFHEFSDMFCKCPDNFRGVLCQIPKETQPSSVSSEPIDSNLFIGFAVGILVLAVIGAGIALGLRRRRSQNKIEPPGESEEESDLPSVA